MTGKEKLIEAIIKEAPDAKTSDFTKDDLNEWLWNSVDSEYLDRGEQLVVAQVGDRFFRYYKHSAVGIEWDTLEEVEPYQETVTKYRKV